MSDSRDKAAEDLKPCPFCGSKSVVWSEGFQRVRCNGCFIGTPGPGPHTRIAGQSLENWKQHAFNEWNARTASAEGLYEALKLLVADVQGYETWDRPCHAVDVARAAIAAYEEGNKGE